MRLVHLTAALLLIAGPVRAEESAVEAAFQAVQRAVEAQDVSALDALVHPQFEMLHALGQIESRDTWLRLVATGRLPRQTARITEYGVTIRVIGSTALRSSVVRFRDTRAGRDMWMRGTATFVREGDRWQQLRQQSTFLGEGPVADLKSGSDYIGTYAIPGRDGFQIVEKDGLLSLHWATGATLPLLPQGGDRFGSGPTSHMIFPRDGEGTVTGATRLGPEGPWWTAVRTQP